ncbi:MAG TPA: serine/threonine-protein kinase, partial [Candidatus Xenobia bacterium]
MCRPNGAVVGDDMLYEVRPDKARGERMKAGDVLQGRYRMVRWLGAGGMGGVYQARHEELGALVAVKQLTLDPWDERNQSAIRQFRQEASILHSLQHPNLPRVFDFFVEQDSYFLVMDYIDGPTLEQVVCNEPISETRLLAWAEQLCQVLHYLHTHEPQVIFRDLKPSNIMLASDGVIKLIDFGIAKSWDRDRGLQTQTRARGAGTSGFAAPEQYGTGTDVGTDIYAFGATLYSLLTRTLPPESTGIAAGLYTIRPLRELRPDVSPETACVIEWMMTIRRNERPISVEAVAKAFGFAWEPPRSRPQDTMRVIRAGNAETLPRLRARPVADVPASRPSVP